jgi:hypothetical protein
MIGEFHGEVRPSRAGGVFLFFVLLLPTLFACGCVLGAAAFALFPEGQRLPGLSLFALAFSLCLAIMMCRATWGAAMLAFWKREVGLVNWTFTLPAFAGILLVAIPGMVVAAIAGEMPWLRVASALGMIGISIPSALVAARRSRGVREK